MQIKNLFFAITAVAVLASCSSKRTLKSDYFRVNPNPLELVGTKVPVNVSVSLPAKFMQKKAELSITPVLKYEGGEAWGPSTSLVGEKAISNNPTISYKNGGNAEMNFSFNFIPAMLQSDLYLTFKYTNKKKTYEIPSLKVASGIDAIVALATAESVPAAIAPDKFQRVIKEAYDASIMFLIQRAEVRMKELEKTDFKNWKQRVIDASKATNQNVSVEVQSYSSPDGGYELNDILSQKREQNTTASLKKGFKNTKANQVEMTAHYTAQDWEGFKELLNRSNIQDKTLILRVLEMYPDSEEREKQIRNISSVFSEVAKDILPQLRRSRLTANIEIIGKSDDEIKALAKNNPSALSIDELLYAATLAPNTNDKAALYAVVAELYPQDYRAINNLGVIAYANGDKKQAKSYFDQAYQLAPEAPELAMNYALLNLCENNLEQAVINLGQASALPEMKEALGLLYLKQGNYAAAAKEYANTLSNNAAIAFILVKDYDKAMNVLNQLPNADAKTRMLQAIVAAKMNQIDLAKKYIDEAVALDAAIIKEISTCLSLETIK